MGGENKTTQTTKQFQSSTPYDPAKPLLETGFADAFRNYSNRRGMTQGYDQTRNLGETRFGDTATRFANNNPVGGALSGLQGVYNGGGLSGGQRDATARLDPFATGDMGISTDAFDRYQTGAPTYSERNLSGIAKGDMLGLDNPDFERILNSASERAATEASMAASGMGRTGSDYHQGVVADRVGDLIANARLGQYNTERDRQVQANQLLDSTSMNRDSLGLSAAGQAAGIQGQNRDRQMQGIRDQFSMGQQGVNNLTGAGSAFNSLYGAMQQPNQDLISLGQTPQRDIGGLLSLAGLGAPYATTFGEGTGTESKPSNLLSKIFGGLLGGGSLLFGGGGPGAYG